MKTPYCGISHGWQRQQGKRTGRKRGRLVGRHLVKRLVLMSEEACRVDRLRGREVGWHGETAGVAWERKQGRETRRKRGCLMGDTLTWNWSWMAKEAG